MAAARSRRDRHLLQNVLDNLDHSFECAARTLVPPQPRRALLTSGRTLRHGITVPHHATAPILDPPDGLVGVRVIVTARARGMPWSGLGRVLRRSSSEQPYDGKAEMLFLKSLPARAPAC